MFNTPNHWEYLIWDTASSESSSMPVYFFCMAPRCFACLNEQTLRFAKLLLEGKKNKLEGSQCSHWLQNYLLSCRENSLHSSVWSQAANGKLQCKQNFPWQLSTYETSNSGKDQKLQVTTWKDPREESCLSLFLGRDFAEIWEWQIHLCCIPNPRLGLPRCFTQIFHILFCWWTWWCCHFSSPGLCSLVVPFAATWVCCWDPAHRDPALCWYLHQTHSWGCLPPHYNTSPTTNFPNNSCL